MSRSWRITSALALIAGLALLVIPRLWPACGMMVRTASGGMVPMRCFYSFQAEFLLGLVALLVSGALFCSLGTEARGVLGFVLTLLGIIIVIIPQSWAIGICADPDAPCHMTRALTVGGGTALFLTGGILSHLNPSLAS